MVVTTSLHSHWLNSRQLLYCILAITVHIAAATLYHWDAKRPSVQTEAVPLHIHLMAQAAPSISAMERSKEKLEAAHELNPPERASSTYTIKTAKQPKPQEQREEKSHTSLLSSGGQGSDQAQVVHEAKYRKQTPPIYPRRAFELGQQGTVTLHAQIAENGLPETITLAKSSGHRLLDNAALAAVRTWEFEPATLNGKFMKRWVRVPVRFVIQ